jgi:hypothetical protein
VIGRFDLYEKRIPSTDSSHSSGKTWSDAWKSGWAEGLSAEDMARDLFQMFRQFL